MKKVCVIVKNYYGDFDMSQQDIVGVAFSKESASNVCMQLNAKRTQIDIDSEVVYTYTEVKTFG